MNKVIGEALPQELKAESEEIASVMDRAVSKALEENRRLGLDEKYYPEAAAIARAACEDKKAEVAEDN